MRAHDVDGKSHGTDRMCCCADAEPDTEPNGQSDCRTDTKPNTIADVIADAEPNAIADTAVLPRRTA